MQVGFLRIYKMKLSSYDNNFQFVGLILSFSVNRLASWPRFLLP